MTYPSYPPWFDHPNNIFWRVQVTQLLIIQSSPASHHFLLGPNTPVSTLFSDTSISVFPLVWDTKFHTRTKQEKV
jgi:hypothetical protein